MPRTVTSAVCVLLLAWATPAWAGSDGRPDREANARAALTHATAVLSGESRGAAATLALLDLRQSLPSLSAADADAAERLLARPAQPNYLCAAHTCVHWNNPGLLGGGGAPPQTDDDTDGVPDWVETTSQVMEQSWRREVVMLGYRMPLPDSQPASLPGGDIPKLDVYLENVGGQGIYGYAATESGARTSPAYLVLDNDYAEFGTAPIKALKATAAHELFHAVQFAYDTTEAGWLMESTATWMEEQVFDGVGDNLNYLPHSSLRLPYQSLTATNGAAEYGNWIFYQFVSEHHGRGVIRDLWRRASRAGVDARTAIAGALRAAGTNLTSTFGRFSTASNAPGRYYEEGEKYPRAEIAGTWSFGGGTRSTGLQQAVLDHLTAANYAFRPGSLSGRWRLRVAVNGPAAWHAAHLLVFLREGGVQRVRIALDGSGAGARVAEFSAGKVRKVVLDVASAGTTDNRISRFRARAIR